MQISIENQPSYACATVKLDPGESFVSESDAMIEMSSDIAVDTTTHTRTGGGFLKGLKRLLASQSFFLSRFSARDGSSRPNGSHVVLAPTLPGDIVQLDLSGERWIVEGGSYLGSGEDIDVDMKFGGIRALAGGEGLFFVALSGHGPVLLSAFGGIFPIDVDGSHVVDCGHVVAFEEHLTYSLRKVAGWKSFIFSGEGLVFEFRGRGRIWLQTHAPSSYGRYVGPRLPARKES